MAVVGVLSPLGDDYMKYEIIKNGTDDYTLKYKDKEIKFYADIDLKRRLEEAPKTSKLKMLKDLAKEGISLKDFTIEQKKDGKTYYDNTNRNELENEYYQNELLDIINASCKERFNMNLTELIIDIGITDQKEQEKFSKELGAVLTGNTPS